MMKPSPSAPVVPRVEGSHLAQADLTEPDKTADMANPTDVTAGKTDKVSNRHVSLLVLGPSGSGKSSFIATVVSGKASKDADIVSHNIESYTSTCTPHTFKFTDTKHNNNTTVTLIDSPGFNDTNRNDLDILQSIADFLTTTTTKTTGNIAGIILTHPITQNRMTGSARLNLAALKALCGEPFYPRVVVLTTMWNTIPSSAADDRRQQMMRDECTRREAQIMASPALWGDLVAGGARVMRFDGTPESTACVLEHFMAMAGGDEGGSSRLSLVNELGTGISLEETSAGRVLVEEKKRREKAHEEEMQRLDKLIEEEEKKKKAQLNDDDVERRRRGGGGEAAALHGNTRPSVVVRAEQRGGLGPVVHSSGENDVITDHHERRDHDRGGRRGREEAGGERGLAGIVLSGMVEMMTRRFQRSTD
ncbi:hypothetical protein QBC37DRAFT_82397 [Rhypophila decipiens]|uniref:G domain-containing protein n=1 Tax=Rhypophila decipiens TaxID=261697 RepID=A0AAN6XW97_9PEZI|nr:hypothetical protein QBC37DRAFT_82397 [Rhypophila decipiens]